MSIAIRIWRWTLGVNVEGGLRYTPPKSKKTTPESKQEPAPRSKFPVGFQPNPQYKQEGPTKTDPNSVPTPTKE